ARLVERANGDDTRDAVHAHAGDAVGDEIPGAGLDDETERIDRPLYDAHPLAVTDADAAAAPDRGRERGQVRDAVLSAEPATRVEVEEPLRPRRPLLELGRERGHDRSEERRVGNGRAARPA